MILQLSGVSKEFHSLRGRITVLRQMDLTVNEGEFFVLLGPSGSGKSTLLNLIAGLEKPTAGRILFGDTVVADAASGRFLSPRERNIAFVFQSYALYPHLTVFENIAFPLRIARKPKAEIAAAVEAAANTLSIADLLAAYPRELSGGQRQRVAIARAIVRQPSIGLLDEPLSNLDAQLRGTMRAELKSLQKRLGITTVYVTHDQVEAMSLGDRIAVLRNARIEQVGMPADLYERPANAFVAQFIGSPPMNLLPAELARQGDGWVAAIGQARLALPKEKVAALGAAPATILVGVRPESVEFCAPSPTQLSAVVLTVEPLGRETTVRFQVAGQTFAAVGPRCEVTPGQTVGIRFASESIHVFPI
jgi:multiple sugar transport system ATP-binding protein